MLVLSLIFIKQPEAAQFWAKILKACHNSYQLQYCIEITI